MSSLGRALLVAGLVLAAAGLLLLLADKPPFQAFFAKLRLGRLPGDIVIDRPGFRFAFPIVTCLLVSAVISLLLYLFRR